MKKRKSQAWSIDLFIGVAVIFIAIIIFYNYSLNLSKVDEDNIAILINDAKTISNFLVDVGSPSNWTADDVSTIGLMSYGKVINESKVSEFSDLVIADYPNSKKLLSSRSDYFVFFEDKAGNYIFINGIQGVGKSGVNQTNIYVSQDPNDVISIYRFIIYRGDIIKLGVFVW